MKLSETTAPLVTLDIAADNPRSPFYAVIALTSLASLLLELSLTRVFSVVYYYHFAFLAISVALFGLGAGGVFAYVVASWRGPVLRRLGTLSLINAGLVLLLLSWLLSTSQPYWQFPITYVLASLPFFVTGTILSLIIAETIQHVHRVYFFDLFGAACGCIVLIPVLNFAGGPGTVLTSAALFAGAGAIWFLMAKWRPGWFWAAAAGALLLILVSVNAHFNLVDVRYAHGLRVHSEWFVKWNSFSRVSIALDPDGFHRVYIDAATSTPIVNARLGNRPGQDPLEPSAELPCLWRHGAKVLVIGPGGGLEVGRCLALGSHDVTGVDINPIIVQTIMRDRFPDLSNGIYLRPDVHIFVEDGRSYVRRSHDRFDVLQLTLIGNWGSTNAGAYTLTENSLYTVDAFRDYLSHLTDTGVMALTRWTFIPPSETMRLTAMAMDALHALGQSEPWRNIIVARERGGLDTIIIARQPFSDADLAMARATMGERHIAAAYLPGDAGTGPGHEFAQLLSSPNPLAYERNYIFNITSVTDNRPFFFFVVQPHDLLRYALHPFYRAGPAPLAVPMLYGLVAISILATLVILLLPPLLLGDRLPRRRGIASCMMYFVCIGAGYILIEVALVQRFIFFLGHPTYSFTVVIFSMLVFSSLGSRYSAALLGTISARLYGVLALIALLVSGLALFVYVFLFSAVALPLWGKIAITIAAIAPAAFTMGMPFPTGLRWLGRWHNPAVRWAWAVNAAASVLGTVTALVVGLFIGLFQTLLVGGGLYLAALCAMWMAERRTSSPRQSTAAAA